MKLFKQWKVRKVLRKLARKSGVSPVFVRASIQEAIDEAWASADPAVMAMQLRLFPSGKPEVGDFIIRLEQEVWNMQ